MRPEEKRQNIRTSRTHPHLISLFAGAIGGVSLALGLIGLQSGALRPAPPALEPAAGAGQSYGDAAAEALATVLSEAGPEAAPALSQMARIGAPAPAATPLKTPRMPALTEAVASGLGAMLTQAPAPALPDEGANRAAAVGHEAEPLNLALSHLRVELGEVDGAAARRTAELAALPLPVPIVTPAEKPAPARIVRNLSIARGDTLMEALLRGGAQPDEAYAAAEALATVQDPRRLRIGQQLKLVFDTADPAKPRLSQVDMDADVERRAVALLRPDGGYAAETVEKPLTRHAVATAGEIDGSLYAAADAAGVPARVIVDLIRLYSFDIDFQRDIQPGDRFELLYEVMLNEAGEAVKSEDILYARLTVGGKALPLYRFRHGDGEAGYYSDKGENVRKALMKTPIDGARLSSSFGLRRHPILGYTKMHRGADFAAPKGTPIMAAGDGTVEVAGWNGGYGRYIRLRHNSEYKTAYAHMTRIAKGLRPGRRVRQGDIIGYVGTTGRSTGPHLHYEVLRSGKQVNPMGLKLPTGRKLTGAERIAFDKAREALDRRYVAALPLPSALAKTN